MEMAMVQSEKNKGSGKTDTMIGKDGDDINDIGESASDSTSGGNNNGGDDDDNGENQPKNKADEEKEDKKPSEEVEASSTPLSPPLSLLPLPPPSPRIVRTAVVVGVKSYGLIIDVGASFNGLVHISEVGKTEWIGKPSSSRIEDLQVGGVSPSLSLSLSRCCVDSCRDSNSAFYIHSLSMRVINTTFWVPLYPPRPSSLSLSLSLRFSLIDSSFFNFVLYHRRLHHLRPW
jgi:hypothetical protein